MAEESTVVLTDPICEGITLLLTQTGARNPGAVARRRLATTLRAVLGRAVTGWHVRRVPGSELPEYDITPPGGETLPIDVAWNLSYALAEQPAVVHAEPAFRVLQDAAPAVATAPSAAALTARGLATPQFENCTDDKPPATVDPDDIDWSPRLVDLPCAWQLEPPVPAPGFAPGKQRGAGIRVGHPDSGYQRHPDLFTEPAGQPVRVLTALERDFVDRDKTAENRDGGHGLNTAGVLMSSDQTGFVVGAAPAAAIVPLRVTKPRLGGNLPAPILFDSGVRNLRDAIRYAVDVAGCHVISISLGWFGSASLHQAIREAVAKNVIICAASGNYVPLVVWPAAYDEVIAIAGCTAERRPWSGASTGPQVDVSGPAQRVWVAGFSANGLPGAAQSDGTSFATATVAGIAALWLAYHGRDYLLDRYRGQFTLTDVFRHVLRVSCDGFAPGSASSGYGAGIVNARRALITPLPTAAGLRAARPRAAAALTAPTPVDTVADVFPDVPRAVLRQRLAALLQTPDDELDARLAGVEQELVFQIATDPQVRAQLGAPAQARGAESALAAPAAQATLAGAPLSERLRARVNYGK